MTIELHDSEPTPARADHAVEVALVGDGSSLFLTGTQAMHQSHKSIYRLVGRNCGDRGPDFRRLRSSRSERLPMSGPPRS